MANPIVKVAGAAIKAVTKSNKPAKKVISRNRQVYDIPVAGNSSKMVAKKMGKGSLVISNNVKLKNVKSPSGKASVGGGASQVMLQNVRASLKTNKSEAKANARGLKAANKPRAPKMSKADIKKFETQIDKLAAEYKAKQKK